MKLNIYRGDKGGGGEGEAGNLGGVGAFLGKVLKRAGQSSCRVFDAEGLADALHRAELEAGGAAAAPAEPGGLHESGGGLQ